MILIEALHLEKDRLLLLVVCAPYAVNLLTNSHTPLLRSLFPAPYYTRVIGHLGQKNALNTPRPSAVVSRAGTSVEPRRTLEISILPLLREWRNKPTHLLNCLCGYTALMNGRRHNQKDRGISQLEDTVSNPSMLREALCLLSSANILPILQRRAGLKLDRPQSKEAPPTSERKYGGMGARPFGFKRCCMLAKG